MCRSSFGKVFPSFNFPIRPERSALLINDMQYFCAHPDHGMGAAAKRNGAAALFADYFQQLDDVVLPNVVRLVAGCRDAGVELVFTRIGSMVAVTRYLDA